MKTILRPLLLASLAVALTGCVGPGTKAKVGATLQVAESIGAVATAIAPDSPAVKKQVADIAAENQKLKDDLAKAVVDLDKVRTIAAGAAGTVGTVVDALGGAGVGTLMANSITKTITGIATDKAEDKSATALTEAKKSIATLKTELEAKDDALNKQIAAAAERTKRDIDDARKEWNALSEKHQAEARAELVALAEQKGIKGAAGMTTEELIAALAAAGFGVAGFLRTFGKSRSASEVDQIAAKQDDQKNNIVETKKGVEDLWDKFTAVDQKVAVLENQAKSCDCPALRTDLATAARQIEDHEHRLAKIRA